MKDIQEEIKFIEEKNIFVQDSIFEIEWHKEMLSLYEESLNKIRKCENRQQLREVFREYAKIVVDKCGNKNERMLDFIETMHPNVEITVED